VRRLILRHLGAALCLSVLVTESLDRQFRVVMPDGVVIERLPVGLARGRWRFAFVVHGYRSAPHLDGMRTVRELNDRVTLKGVDGVLEQRDSDSSGGDGQHGFRVQCLDGGVSEARLTYSHRGETIASEFVPLVSGDQTTVELPNGVVVERLPVGYANGAWHVTFVWSGHDPSFDENKDAVPFCRFGSTAEGLLAVSGVDETLERVGGGASGGHEHEQRLEYQDNGLRALRVVYGEPGAPAATETINLR
jgi:hypothetical protein